MPLNIQKTDELLQKANSLPLTPGVYVMKDKNGKVIYVGKSKKLKNRVSQYFQKTQKNIKTSKMVSLVYDFDFIICESEIEALTLENTLIKQYSPKYNIRLKDAKSYPYIKVTDGKYPRIVFTRTRISDKARYFGPFSGASTVFSVLDIIHKSLGIPSCKRQFPRDIGKERPCLYYQMGQCCGVCTGKVTEEEYASLIKCATDILKGNIVEAKNSLTEQMLRLADEEKFEAAAKCRDTINALERLHQKQHVVAAPEAEMDVFGLWQDDYGTCISCLYIRSGAVIYNADHIFSAETEADEDALCAFFVEHYNMKNYIPKEIIISFSLSNDNKALLEEYFENKSGRKAYIRKPERGNTKKLCDTVVTNAREKLNQSRLEAQKDEKVLINLAKQLMLESVPQRIEAYDISNIGAENITAGMVVYVNGKPSKQDYRVFNIKSVLGTDDYGSMREAISRRMSHLVNDKMGSFSQYPDLILIDGGKGHVGVVKEITKEYGIDIPVFGMVKDDYHKTRALCTESDEINIAKDKAIFTLIYKIQEEVHRFTVGKTLHQKRATLKRSSLEKIDGIGPAKAKNLLGAFGTLSALRQASEEQIAAVAGISNKDAQNVYLYFRQKEGNQK